MIELVLGHFNYWISAALIMVGLYIVMTNANLIKKIIGLSIFQSAVFILYISMGKVDGGSAPIAIASKTAQVYSNPLPHVLILTAIVVGVATTAVALALAVRIHQAYGSLEEDDIKQADQGDLH